MGGKDWLNDGREGTVSRFLNALSWYGTWHEVSRGWREHGVIMIVGTEGLALRMTSGSGERVLQELVELESSSDPFPGDMDTGSLIGSASSSNDAKRLATCSMSFSRWNRVPCTLGSLHVRTSVLHGPK